MTERPTPEGQASRRPRWRDRLSEGRWLLLASAFVFIVLVSLGEMSPLFGAGGFLVLLVVALVVPRDAERSRPDPEEAARMAETREIAVRNFADTLADPCFILDQRVIIVHRNAAAASQFPGAMPGNPLAFSIRNPALLSAIEKARASRLTQVAEIHQTVPNETWFRAVAAPLSPEGKGYFRAPERIVVTLTNLTEQKRIETMRADFVANASHELRTPLTSLIGFIETLQGPAAKDHEARERFLGIMRGQAERMSVLIDDLLSLSRIELRQHLRPTGSVDLALILKEVAEGLQTQAKEAGVGIRVTVPGEKVTVTGDRDELYQVFENLIDNAIKYGADGGDIEVTLAPVRRAGFAHQVNIIDHGPGIAEEHVPRLTERFYRVDAESSRKKKGTGLGLAIVKHIIARHGGQMTIRSRLGAGTNVEILLPGSPV